MLKRLPAILGLIMLLCLVAHAGEKSIDCRWVGGLGFDRNLGGAWTTLPREERFEACDPAQAQALAADPAFRRHYATSEGVAARGMRFMTAYTGEGWFLGIECDEPQLADVQARANAGKAGPELLEILFAASDTAAYDHLVIDLTAQTFTDARLVESGASAYPLIPVFDRDDLNTPGSTFRASVVPGEGKWRVCLFVPFAFLSDHLQAGGTWRFNIVRWMPGARAGAVQWCGNAYDPASWGTLRWEMPVGEKGAAIRQAMIKQAWARFKKDSTEQWLYWNEQKIDPVFATQRLRPVIAAHQLLVGAKSKVTAAPTPDDPLEGEKLGELVVDPATLPLPWENYEVKITNIAKATPEETEAMFRAIPEWLTFNRRCDALRRAYLLETLIAQPK